MMVTQAFLYNAIFFTYALVLQRLLHISSAFQLLLLPVRDRQPGRAAAARPAVRHDRPAQDDPRTYAISASCCSSRRCCSTPDTERRVADRVLVRGLLLRLGRRLLGVPDGERDLPDRAAGSGDLVLLRDLADLRRHRDLAVRPPDRRCEQQQSRPWTAHGGLLPGGRGDHPGLILAAFLAVDAERKSLEDIADPMSKARGPVELTGSRWGPPSR